MFQSHRFQCYCHTFFCLRFDGSTIANPGNEHWLRHRLQTIYSFSWQGGSLQCPETIWNPPDPSFHIPALFTLLRRQMSFVLVWYQGALLCLSLYASRRSNKQWDAESKWSKDVALSSLTCVVMEAWAYFDDFFFYADLTFAVLFTCSGM